MSKGTPSLLVSWRLSGKTVLVVGGDEMGLFRVKACLTAKATVTVCAPEISDPELKDLLKKNHDTVQWTPRWPEKGDLVGHSLVLLANFDEAQAKELRVWTQDLSIPFHAADIPDQCDFWFPSTFNDGPLQVAVTTNGEGPGLARKIRQEVQHSLPTGATQSLKNYSKLRSKLKSITTRTMDDRFQWLRSITKNNTLEDIRRWSDQEINQMVERFKEKKPPKAIGKLWLVGAGPGSPDLLTVGASKAIQQADVVITDRLVPQSITDLVQGTLILAPRKRKAGRLAQLHLNQMVLEHLRRGHFVVRLKAGDPFLFGRGGEEIRFFRKYGFEPRVLPGVTSAIAAPASAGIPVTDRTVANQLLIVTGRDKDGQLPDLPPYHPERTVVVLMGVKVLPLLMEKLIGLGYPTETPCALIERATHLEEKSIRGTVADIASLARTQRIAAPASLIIGKVVSVLEQEQIMNNTLAMVG